MSFAIPTDDEGTVIEGNLSIQPKDGSNQASLEVLSTIFSNKLNEYNPGYGIHILNTQNVTGPTSASLVLYGGSKFQKELSLDSYLDIKGSTPTNPDPNYARIFYNTTGNLLQTLDSNGKLNTFNPLTTKGDLITHNGTTETRLPIGTDSYILAADSAESTGLKWVVNTGGGETNTASNVGAGVGVFKQKTGNDLEFKSITSTTNRITVASDTSEVDLTLEEGNIVHQNLSGAGTNTHSQIDSHISSTLNPHSVTIDQITPTTTKGDLLVENGTNVVRLPIGTDGQVIRANSATGSGIEWDDFDHGSLLGLGDDDHTQYLLLGGRAGGQIAIGGINASDNLTLTSTSDTSKGQVILTETTESTSTSSGAIRIDGGAGIAGNVYIGNTLAVDTIIENTVSNGVDLEGTVFKDSYLTITEVSVPGNPSSSKHTLYIDSGDSLLKSRDSSGVVTTLQPTNTKGDLVTHTGTTQTRLPVGSDTQVLTVDPLQPTGIKWENVSSGTGGTGTDPNSNKYCNIYSSGSQTLTDTYQDILFDSDRRIDDFYTHSLLEQELITFNQPGKYFVYFRCSTFVETGNNRASSGIRLVLDTGGGFNEIAGTLAYMFNRDNDQGYNTCCTNIVLDVSAGDVIKAQVRREVGSTTIKTLQNASEIVIIRMTVDQANDLTEYLSVYKSNSNNFGSSYSDLVFNTTRINDSIYTYSTSTGIVELTENGIYFITCNVSTQTNSNTETQTSFRLVADTGGGYNEVSGSRGYMHNDDDPDSLNTGFISLVYNGTTGDKLKIQTIIDNGAGTASNVANGCNLNVIKLGSSLGQSTVKYFDGYNDTGGTSISTSYTDIPIISENIKDSIYTHTASSPSITVTEDGRYIIFARICFVKSSGTTETAVKTRLVVDNGSGFFEISGTEAYSYHTNTSTGTQQSFIGATIQLAANSIMKLQGIIFDGNNIEVANYGTGISVMRLEPLNVGQQGLVIFGTELNYVESTSTTSTNSLTYVQKIRLTTDNIPSGTYRIGFYYIWTIDNTNQDFTSRVQVDDSLDIHESTESIHRSNQDIATSGFSHVSLSLGVHTIDLDFKVDSGTTNASIKDARIEIWRLS